MTEAGVNALLTALAVGEAAAYAELYDRLAGRLYGAAVRIVRNSNDAEDAVQEVFVALYRGRERIRDVRDLEAYLFTALRRATIRCVKRRGESTPLGIVDVAAPAVAEDDRPARLERAIARLPAAQREAIALKIDGGLSFAQIAEVLGISPNTAASRYRYALEKLKSLVEDHGS